MRSSLGPFPRLTTAIAPALALTAILAGVVSGLHHHALADSHGQCAVCSFGATPSTAAVADASPGSPDAPAGRCALPGLPAPRELAVAAAPSRAPPRG
jgi:hypothetical protein